jgi:hypothetical protein
MATALEVARLISVTEAARCLRPVRGRPVSPDTVRTWSTRGFACGAKLPRHRVAGRWVVDVAELREFVSAMSCAQMRD